VSSQGSQRRTAARLASFGVNGAGLAVMLLVFAQTGGLTGAEVLVAGGTSALSQKLLEAVFGDGAVRALATQARRDLMDRVEALLDAEAERFRSLVLAGAPEAGASAGLRTAAHGLEQARRATAAVSRPAPAAAPPAPIGPEPRTSWWRRAFG
jgi:DNA-binding transcriptional MocR family regulator